MAKLLLIDACSGHAGIHEAELQAAGYSVVTHRDGKVPSQLETIAPDLILLDMPAKAGIERLRQLKSGSHAYSIPIILLSANKDEELIIQALDLGAYDFVSKPVIYPVLTARIRAALRLRDNQQLLAQANRNLAKLASQDPLTEVYNRRYFLQRAEVELNHARRHNRPLAMIMLDLDKFKAVNDRYGHSMGDNALIELTMICADNIRTADFVGRLGGEEFAVCCPDADLAGALRLAERIREAIDQRRIYHHEDICSVSISLGVSALRDEDRNLEEFLDRADQLLYQAKAQGRNRVVAG